MKYSRRVNEHQAPPLAAKWLAGALTRPIEDERKATCSNCAMAPGPQFDSIEEAYTSGVKCCTYLPDLANFLVGNILTDTDPVGASSRRFIEQRMLDGASVTPLGVPAAPLYALLYDQKHPSSFGRAGALACPYYVMDGGLCGIHKHREAVCSTWFCTHNRGPAGRFFWLSVEAFLRAVERALVLWCIDQFDLPVLARRALFGMETRPRNIDPATLVGKSNPQLARLVWGPWYNRQYEFFVTCGQKVSALAWPEVLAIGGHPVDYAARVMRETQEQLHEPTLPENVLRGVGQQLVQITARGTARVRSQVSSDRLEIPLEVLHVLPRLSGGPLSDMRAALAAQGVTLDDATLQQLIDYQVLIPA
jgi:hypothetical protein